MYSEKNVVQFGQPQQIAITPQPIQNADYGERLLAPHSNQYYLNQYAGHYQENIAPQHVEINNHAPQEIQVQLEGHGSSTPQPYPNQNPALSHNSYSTLQHQPDFDDIKIENREGTLPQHVIDNINNQYGAISQGNLEPRGFAHHFENNGQSIAQNVNALQDHSGHNQPNVYVSSTEPSVHYVSSAQGNLHSNIGYVTEPNLQHNIGYESSSPNVQNGGYAASTVPNIQQNYVSSTPSPIQHNYVSSTPSLIEHTGGYIASTVPNLQQHYVTSADRSVQNTYVSSTEPTVNYVSTTPAPIALQQNVNYLQQGYPTDVQIIPNGENSIPVHSQQPAPQENVQVSTERPPVNPLLMNLVNILKTHMPEQYKNRFESMLRPYIDTPVGKIVPHFSDGVSSTTPIPVTHVDSRTGHQAYPNNPFLNGEVQLDTNHNLNQAQGQPSKQDYAQNPYVTGEVKVGQISPDYLVPGVTPTPDYSSYSQQQNAAYQNQQIHQTNDAPQYNYNNLGNIAIAQDRSGQDYINLQHQIHAKLGQDFRGDPNNYDENNNARKVYYELDPAAYQGGYHQHLQRNANSQQQGKDGTVFAVTNQNGQSLQTPNFYQPIDPNMYPKNLLALNPNYQSDQASGATNNGYIWNAGDYSAPREPEILVRQLNQTCASFRFNTTNEYEQRDQDISIWNSGDYSALRPQEELIRSVNITCDNFTNDYTNNFTSGFSLWQYCSQCLNRDAQDVTSVQREVVIGPDGEQREFIYSKAQQEQIYNSNANGDGSNYNYEDPRSNAEIAGIVKVYNPDYTPQEYQNDPQSKIGDNFATFISNFNAEVNKRKPIYVPNYEEQNDGEYDYADNGNGVYKRNAQNNNNNRKFVVYVKKPNSA